MSPTRTLPPPGVQPPCGEPGSDCGGGDGRAPGAGEGGDGEVPAEQGALQQPEEGEGEAARTLHCPSPPGALGGSLGRTGLDPVSFGLSWALTRPFLIDLLLLPNQVPAVLLAAQLSLLQEVSLLQARGLGCELPWGRGEGGGKKAPGQLCPMELPAVVGVLSCTVDIAPKEPNLTF